MKTRLISMALACLLAASCSSSTAFAAKRRAVPARGPAQWNHDWANGAVFYEIFVRSFKDSNGDGVGDLNGLIEKLDYLNDGNPATSTDLGIDAIWLMPVFESPSYHGYDTVDYETIARDYGSNADFQRLLSEAHHRGIRVIVDYVMNHTGSEHPWFIDSASSPTSAKRDWYVWSSTDQGWTQPWGGSNPTWHPKNGAWFYGVFWAGMPDLNYRTPAVRREMERIARLWLQQGVDGFRLDATRHLIEDGPGAAQTDTPETHALLKEFATFVRQTKPESILVAENWTDTPIIATYYGSTAAIKGGDEMPMNFDFPLAAAIVEGVNAGRANGIADKLREILRTYPQGIIDAPFLTNHDQVRLATVFGNNTSKMKNAAAILLTLPGAPFLYYGEEVGLQNGPTSGDESKRTPMPWDNANGFTTGAPWFGYAPGREQENIAAEANDPGSLWSRYRDLITARHSSSALMHGSIEVLDTASSVLAFVRTAGNERVLVVHNVTDGFVNAGPMNVPNAGFEKIFTDGTLADPSGSLTLPPRATGIWRIR
ncbi:MAG TPA: alpha-amylase family glycosyl hydrolase [Thermoanaerobaculia bacterium]|nr:alpha-amylase family glycosyl hydrolase [Thermoanaerobaculia bacterium]